MGVQRTAFYVTEEQLAWLRETRRFREGQEKIVGKQGHRDSEWEIACDLIGIPRYHAGKLKEVMTR